MEKTQQPKGLNIALWAVQIILALLYLMAGASKTFQPVEELGKTLPWVLTTPLALVRFIGLSESAGALGLLLPSLLRIRPLLTVYAAIGLTLVQVFAAIFHVSQGESNVLGINLVFLLLSGFVAWGRLKKSPIVAK